MKSIFYAITFLLFSFWATTLSAQTLVNKSWQDTTGNPHDTMSLLLGETDGSSNFVMVGNTWPTSDSELILITKMTNSGSVIWQSRLSSTSTKRIIATDLDISNGYIYITGTGYDSVNSKSTFATEKISDSTGATIWTEKYTPTFTGYAVASAVREDNAGSVFVSGTEQVNDTSYEMTFLKYNSSGTVQWTTHYDSSGLYSGAIGMGTVASDSLFPVSGYSGQTFGAWDIVSMQVNAYTGAVSSVSRVHNGTGSFISHPVAVAKDTHGDTYIVGASEVSGPNVDIKLIKCDSLFNQTWVKTWGGADSLDDEPASMTIDTNGYLTITGYTSHASGEIDFLTVRYDKNGNLKWSKTFNNSNTGGVPIAQGASITRDGGGNIYVTGKVYNGSNYDIATLAYDTSGNVLWQQTNDDNNSNDIGMNVSLDVANDVYVSGTTTNGATTKYITLMYKQATAYIPFDSTDVNSPFAFYTNYGQLFSSDTLRSADSIYFYTTAGNPQLFVGDGKLSYVTGYSDTTHTYDSVVRFDMCLSNLDQKGYTNTGIFPSSPVNPYLNYYLGYMQKPAARIVGNDRIVEKGVYNGIDWQLCSIKQGIKNYFVVNPGGNPSEIKMQFKGVNSISTTGNAMKITSNAGYLQFDTLVAYTVDSVGDTLHIAIAYNSLGGNSYGFTLGTYNTGRTLVIQSNLKSLEKSASLTGVKWSTYYGGGGNDLARNIKVDNSNNKYITGSTSSQNLPSATGTSPSGTNSISFLTKFDNNDALKWAIYFGGSTGSEGNGIAFNSAGQVFVCGTTQDQDFANVQPGSAFQFNPDFTSNPNNSYVAEFDPAAGTPIWKTYYDGSQVSIAFDGDNNLYMVGDGASSNFPFKNSVNGCTSCFQFSAGAGCISKFNSSLAQTWATTFGDAATNLSGVTAVSGSSASVYMVGASNDITSTNFTLKNGSPEYSQAFKGSYDGVVLNFDGSDNLLYSTFFGGDENNSATPGTGTTVLTGVVGATVTDGGPQDRVYICGYTSCIDLPVKNQTGSSGFQGSKIAPGAADNDAVFISFGTDNTQKYTTYYGGTGDDIATAIVPGQSGLYIGQAAYMVGWTTSSDLTSVTPSNYFSQSSLVGTNNPTECFIASILEGDLLWSTYIGGSITDRPNGVATDNNQNLFIAGTTNSSQVPVAANGYPLFMNNTGYFQGDLNQTNSAVMNPPTDAFITEFDISGLATGVKNVVANANALIVYPNPSGDYIRVIIPDYNGSELQMQIFDVLGQMLYRNNQSPSYIDISSLSPGVYLLKCRGMSINKTAKFVKE